MKKLVFEATAELCQIHDIAKKVAALLETQEFCLWLNAPMGAGKTTFTNYFLKALGLPEIIPVTSPTFAYINEYTIGDKLYAHMDLYRINDPFFSIEELGLTDDRNFSGLIVEWGEKLNHEKKIEPTHILEISIEKNDFNNRVYKLFTTSEIN